MEIFATLPVYIGAALFIGTFVAVTVVAGLAFHRLAPHDVLEHHNDIAGFMFAVVGVVYAVLLAFLAIAVWERYAAAESRVFDEANQLDVVYRRVDGFPSDAARLRAQIAHYTDVVINEEWQAMDKGGQSNRANRLVERIAYEVRHLRVTTPGQQDVLTSLMESLQAAMIDRHDRLTLSKTGLHGFLWGILFCGAGGTLLFSFLFAFKNVGAQIAMTGLLAFSLGLVLYLIAAVDYPFRGDVRISAAPFVLARAAFAEVDR